METLIHMTAAYSNAVLLVVLTHVSDFARKLELPVPLPVTTSQVAEFKPHPFQHMVGRWLTLSNEDPGDGFQAITFHIDAQKKEVTRFTLVSTNAWRPDPPPGIEPELEVDYRRRMQGSLQVRTNPPNPFLARPQVGPE